METFNHTPHWYVGALLGALIGMGAASLRNNYLYSPSRSEDGVRGAHTRTMNYSF